ncbi:MAG: UDP-N-acetylenolpyruvoylglucosamine reductase [Firmicutes bacterium]|nr:UDP-N-acetylenolpyruvoylglucosamine reductase [Bacillota bacterium]
MYPQEVLEQLKKYIPPSKIKTNEPMKDHTSFKIGGPADIMVFPSSIEEIVATVEICKQNSCPYFIMGNGTNLLVSDSGYRGVIVKTAANMKDCSIDGERVYGQAGILLSTLSKNVIEAGLEGFEFAHGIPGTLGGAVAMNAGAYGGEIKDVLKWARLLTPEGDIKTYSNSRLKLGYRSSLVQAEGLIVLDCELVFKKGDRKQIDERIREYTQLRKSKQPLHLPSAGSIFKRPEGYYAGKLIEQAGLRGKRIGDAQVSELHCGFIVNVGNATAQDVISLINYVKDEVRDKFGVELQPEIKVVGDMGRIKV